MKLICAPILLAACVSAWSPSNGYTPMVVECPNGGASFVRRGHSLSEDETDWVEERHKVTNPQLETFLNRVGMEDFDPHEFLSNTSINIGLAFSGGGYRAMLAGAGQLAALDSRTENSMQEGHLGGILQASTYLAGLSGGGWLVSSVVLNNFSSVQSLQNDPNLWDLSLPNFSNPDALNDATQYFGDINREINEKRQAGFATSVTDFWGRALAYQMIGDRKGGASVEFSDVRNYTAFINHEMPLPFVVSLGRAPDTFVVNTNSTVFEISPLSMGSWDPTLFAFTDTKYIGTNVSNGVPLDIHGCVTGYDNGGFILGTSSSLFNRLILRFQNYLADFFRALFRQIFGIFEQTDLDVALFKPNPFKDVPDSSSIGAANFLSLVDGGEDGQNVPFYPLQQPIRGLDIIFAYDNSANHHNYPDGSALMTTYGRQFSDQGNHTIFPHAPDNRSYVNLGLNTRPVFFGCYASNFTSLRADVGADKTETPPLIVYTPNSRHSYLSNTSTFKLNYNTQEIAGMIQNGYETATRGNSTLDSEWTACVGCAIVQREVERRGIPQSDQCQKCFAQYCWDGSLNTTIIDTDAYNPG